MLALTTLVLSSVWQATAHVLPRDIDESLLSGNDTGNGTAPVRGDYTWTPTCKLPSAKDFMFPMGFDNFEKCVPAVGTVNALMIFVDFPDAEDERSPKAMHDQLVPEAIEWYNQASYGKLNLNVKADTSAYLRMPKKASEYGWMQGGFWQDNYLNDALDVFTANGSRPAPEADFLYVVPTGRAANSLARSITRFDPISTRHGKKVTYKKAVLMAATEWDLQSMILVHETGHVFCMSDYYAFSGYQHQFTGEWGVMGMETGMAPDYFAWDKYRLGWIEDKAVDCVLEAGSTTHVLTPLAWDIDGKKAVIIAQSEISALVAEVRIATGLDGKICAPGVLLYKISIRAGNGALEVIDATPESLGCAGKLEDKNDATLSLTLEGSESLAYAPVSSLEVPGWDVNVTLVSVKGTDYTIRVDRKTDVKTDSW
ncbi:hypothetical protein FPOAC2_04306 [Fusarium poae]|jgi:M6 family metalloprotease-like protein|uniref:hypothetical protein n=1 Tax=Fusarium poae TaxID=36050 RepID=UPI001CEBB603|nr:hypothetical protein FPOAC1_004237 [Fusarium poae]KAG8671001.1 hypothetical protein FPOAC1_004237 [Fusarium poae]